MYISDLSLQGFKSFAQKEKLHFGEGITAVVGPNGCGKTNIVDAIRWVLGEQKYSTLRSSRMEDIIFNGSESKRPVNVCEVSLVVHNNRGMLPVDYNDVEIARRIFRNGESQYMINRSKCRLKDIQDLFVDTGMGADAYSVIELKMIEDILSENADDRRRMFEEAAGINKYKHQRKTTLNRLELTKGDLNRVSDIISEVESKVQALRLQLKRYDRHAKLTRKLQELEIELAYLQQYDLRNKIEPLQNKIESLTLHQSTRKDAEQGREDALEKLRSISRKQQEELAAIQEKIDSLTEIRQEKNNRILVLSEQIKTTKRDIERATQESSACDIRISDYKKAMNSINRELTEVDPNVEAKLTEFQVAQQQLEKDSADYTYKQESYDKLTEQFIKYQHEENTLKSLVERTEYLLEDRRHQLSELSNQSAAIENQIEELEQRQVLIQEDIDLVQTQYEEQKAYLTELNKTYNDLSERKDELSRKKQFAEGKEATLKEQIKFYQNIIDSNEGHPSGTRTVLNNLKNFPGVIGTLSDLINVDKQYRPAIEATLGEYQSLLIAKTRRQAIVVSDSINKAKAGTVYIISLDSVPSRSKKNQSSMNGIIDNAANLVNCEESIRPLVDFLLGDTIVVKDNTTAERYRKEIEFSGNIVDLDGTYYDYNGLIRTTGRGEESILSRKEILSKLEKELENISVEELVTELSTIEQSYKETFNEREKISREMKVLQSQLSELSTEAATILPLLSQYQSRKDEFSTSKLNLKNEINGLEGNLERDRTQIAKIVEKTSKQKNLVGDARSSLENARSQYEATNTQVQQIKLDLMDLEKRRDALHYRIEGIKEIINEKKQRKNELISERDLLKSSLTEKEQEIKTLEKESTKINAQYLKQISIRDLRKEAYSETQEQIEYHEREIRDELREREREIEELKRLELQVADFSRQTDLISSRIQEKYKTPIPSVLDVQWDVVDISLEIDKIERSLERIGPVNMAVKDEFEVEHNRLEFLQKQRSDLEESEKSLLKSIHHIDTKARKQFTDTFESIRENFKKTFVLFFEGGEANLELRGDDPLESDITILARPPGKRTQNLRMLSAGEKALTAISLLFSIYQVKPSPFCILDEVDAPLDDNNIGKFTRALEKFSDQTQFIIVTHNKLTMEAARFLYGVTMEQSGVSKIVSVRFD